MQTMEFVPHKIGSHSYKIRIEDISLFSINNGKVSRFIGYQLTSLATSFHFNFFTKSTSSKPSVSGLHS